MAINTALKFAIWDRHTTQTEIAKRTAIHESRLSRIIRGHDAPTDEEKKRIAKALRVPAEQVFGAPAA